MKKKNSEPRPLLRLVESPTGRRMKISRSFLEQIVREELTEALRETDDEDEETEGTPPPKRGPSVHDASRTGKAGDARKGPADAMPQGSRARPDPIAGADDDDDAEVPDVEDPADDEISADVDDEDDGDSKLADELVGKTIQSVTMEPKSKLVPGAQELVITFNEIADPLRVLVTKSGEIRFFFRGGLHNLL